MSGAGQCGAGGKEPMTYLAWLRSRNGGGTRQRDATRRGWCFPSNRSTKNAPYLYALTCERGEYSIEFTFDVLDGNMAGRCQDPVLALKVDTKLK